MITEYPQISRGRWPEFADDTRTFRQAAHAEFPELPRAVWHVSLTDITDARTRGKNLVPLRLAMGRRLSAIWDDMKDGKRRDDWAARNGWPFMLHLSYLVDAEELT